MENNMKYNTKIPLVIDHSWYDIYGQPLIYAHNEDQSSL